MSPGSPRLPARENDPMGQTGGASRMSVCWDSRDLCVCLHGPGWPKESIMGIYPVFTSIPRFSLLICQSTCSPTKALHVLRQTSVLQIVDGLIDSFPHATHTVVWNMTPLNPGTGSVVFFSRPQAVPPAFNPDHDRRKMPPFIFLVNHWKVMFTLRGPLAEVPSRSDEGAASLHVGRPHGAHRGPAQLTVWTHATPEGVF